MIYHLLKFIDKTFDTPGAGMFQYLTFRAVVAVILALLIGAIFGKKVINLLRRKQIGEQIRNLGLDGQMQKKGTPTMGGIIILFSILVPTLLLGDLTNVYVILMIVSTIWLGAIGFVDDYIKVFKKKKEGLSGKLKVVAQVGLGIIIGTVMCFNADIVVRDSASQRAENGGVAISEKTTQTTIPFVKDNEFDYEWLVPGQGEQDDFLTWLLYIIVAVFIITALSNSANLTDGLDGLVTGISAPIVVVLGVLAYLSGHVVYADYLNIMYLPGTGELVIFAAAMAGALFGFLWYNCYPAQIFMGDTGSLAIGGIIGVFALLIRKELMLPLLCGIFLIESLSVIIQVSYFKYTKRKYGEGRRVFLMTPVHHHYQKQNFPESKIVMRFWIIQLLLAAVTLITLKIR